MDSIPVIDRLSRARNCSARGRIHRAADFGWCEQGKTMEEDTSKKSGKDKIELPRDGRKRFVGEDGKGQYRRGLKGGLVWIILFLVTLFTN